MVNNEKEVKKIMDAHNLNLKLLENSITQIEECSDYNSNQIYSSELSFFIDNKKYLFEMTVKKYDRFFDENGNELFGDDIKNFVECITNYDVLDIKVSSTDGSNDENCFVHNF